MEGTEDLGDGLHPIDALSAAKLGRLNGLPMKDGKSVRLVASALGKVHYRPEIVCRVAREYRLTRGEAAKRRLATELGLTSAAELWNVWSVLQGGRYDPILEEHGIPPFRRGLPPLQGP